MLPLIARGLHPLAAANRHVFAIGVAAATRRQPPPHCGVSRSAPSPEPAAIAAALRHRRP